VRAQRPHGARTEAWLKRDAAVITPAYHRYTDIVAVRGEGSYLFDVEGRKFLDLSCGIAVTSLGHSHPAVVEAVREQAARLTHVSVTTQHDLNIRLAEKLVDIAPAGLQMCFFGNSGAEAVEGAMKLARRVTGRTEIIAFNGGFHGRTFGAMSLTTSKSHYREGYGPLLPGIHHVPYAYPLRMGGEDASVLRSEAAIMALFERHDPSSFAAFIVEPVLGEGGYVVPPPGFMPMLRRLADEHDILLIADEVQSGMCRTGEWWAVDHTGCLPDVMLVAKALANGMPISAILARRDLMGAWPPGAHGSTFGGNPVSCAAALATIDVMEKEGLAARAARLGSDIHERLSESVARQEGVAELRGIGMMIGVEFEADGAARNGKERQEAVRRACLDNQVLLLSCGSEDEVIRMIPPLNISPEDLDKGLTVFEEAVASTAA